MFNLPNQFQSPHQIIITSNCKYLSVLCMKFYIIIFLMIFLIAWVCKCVMKRTGPRRAVQGVSDAITSPHQESIRNGCAATTCLPHELLTMVPLVREIPTSGTRFKLDCFVLAKDNRNENMFVTTLLYFWLFVLDNI